MHTCGMRNNYPIKKKKLLEIEEINIFLFLNSKKTFHFSSN
jgi:hypothetical protein